MNSMQQRFVQGISPYSLQIENGQFIYPTWRPQPLYQDLRSTGTSRLLSPPSLNNQSPYKRTLIEATRKTT